MLFVALFLSLSHHLCSAVEATNAESRDIYVIMRTQLAKRLRAKLQDEKTRLQLLEDRASKRPAASVADAVSMQRSRCESQRW